VNTRSSSPRTRDGTSTTAWTTSRRLRSLAGENRSQEQLRMRNRFHLLGCKCSVWERDVVYRPARTPGCPVLRVCCLPPVCYSTTLLPCYSTTLLPCYSTTLLPCYSTTLLPCYSTTLLRGRSASVLICSLSIQASFRQGSEAWDPSEHSSLSVASWPLLTQHTVLATPHSAYRLGHSSLNIPSWPHQECFDMMFVKNTVNTQGEGSQGRRVTK